MVAKRLLVVTAVAETSAGMMLLAVPAFVTALLLGASPEGPAALVVARIAGAALLSLGCVCWLARDDGPSRTRRGLVAALVLYNCAAVAVLARAGAGPMPVGILMWPAVALHAGLAAWSTASLRRRPTTASGAHAHEFPW
jgi:hypothetical protein